MRGSIEIASLPFGLRSAESGTKHLLKRVFYPLFNICFFVLFFSYCCVVVNYVIGHEINDEILYLYF